MGNVRVLEASLKAALSNLSTGKILLIVLSLIILIGIVTFIIINKRRSRR